ncbi:class I SAM-dependent methyltransferase [Paenibacillus sacheonensis]|uniref:Methyltransferase domain-containing protein n=1 Tax=Paenibacillus sacheonensis TaxID=742054 RepID=A0A7X4YPR6_9BACL|nr:class I SAM-dependent methyltransferase [Paenibacillus sacheonensis]MBM7564970.1 SAM-dependent methyltransferase [Paenibacillus sacheonensis]NBC70242.1 methyltransferase domain-containing protein [Paenibacillus sacheonensis]
MNGSEYKAFYDQVGKLNGWNFSQVKAASEGAKWDFFDEVAKRCKKTDFLLDIGTGGGEALLAIADAAQLLVGIDQSEGMIHTAAKNLADAKATNVRFVQMEAEHITFPPNFFDVVSCRHSEFCAHEVAKVLAPSGVFLTQQVSEADKYNLTQAFGRGQRSVIRSGTLKEKYLHELAEAGFADMQSYEYDAAEYFRTYEDLLFLLKHAPIIPNFGQSDQDFAILRDFVEVNQSAKGIRTNSARFMIVARK